MCPSTLTIRVSLYYLHEFTTLPLAIWVLPRRKAEALLDPLRIGISLLIFDLIHLCSIDNPASLLQ